MTVELLPDAEKELREAARYYEDEAPGVGLAFVAEVRRALAGIGESPLLAQEVTSGLRRKVLPHFPYSLLYAVERGIVVVVAVAHQKRRPHYWTRRLRQAKSRR